MNPAARFPTINGMLAPDAAESGSCKDPYCFPAAVDGGVSKTHLHAILACLTAAEYEALAQSSFSPSARRAKRLDERDALYYALGAELAANADISLRRLARDVEKAVGDYHANGWMRERYLCAPKDRRRALIWEILKLREGGKGFKLPRAPQIYRILSGKRTPPP